MTRASNKSVNNDGVVRLTLFRGTGQIQMLKG